MCGGFKITDWKRNSDGPRSIEQVASLLEANDIIVPRDVRFVRYDELPHGVGASYLLTHLCSNNTQFDWNSLLNRYGEVPIKVAPSVLDSDEEIISVLSHELFELELLRGHLASNGTVSGSQINLLISTETTNKNFHCLASQHGDRAVLKFRQGHHD